MDNVVKIKGGTEVKNAEAVAKIVAWLRKEADAIESGETRPAHKAVLVTYEDLGDDVIVNSSFCNARLVERAGILHMALNDMVNKS